MKLMRVGELGKEVPVVLDGENLMRDVSSISADFMGDALSDDNLNKIAQADLSSLPIVQESRIGACVALGGRFFCIGLNYSDHAAEAGLPVPEKPILFMKVCPVTGPNDPVTVPKNSKKMDWEVELGVVIGKRAAHVSESEALDHVAGYCVINDFSERAFQIEEGGQWVKGKSCDGFGPVGPYLVTRDEISDPQALDMYLDVNGERQQAGNTKTMIFSVRTIIAHLSQFMTLMPGDIITTGTPPGVGMGKSPQQFLKVGDEIELGIEGLGVQRQKIIS